MNMVSTILEIKPFKYGLTISMIDDNDNSIPAEAIAHFNDCKLIVRKKIASDVYSIMHEAFHVMCDVMKKKNVQLDDNTEEVFAYTLEEVTKGITKKVNQLHRQFELKGSEFERQT